MMKAAAVSWRILVLARQVHLKRRKNPVQNLRPRLTRPKKKNLQRLDLRRQLQSRSLQKLPSLVKKKNRLQRKMITAAVEFYPILVLAAGVMTIHLHHQRRIRILKLQQ